MTKPSRILIRTTTAVLAEAMFPAEGLAGYNCGVYPGTTIPVRKLNGREPVTIHGTSAGALVESDEGETWIEDRFGALGARQIQRLLGKVSSKG